LKEDLEFDNQRKDEEIAIIGRRHPWILAKVGIVVVVSILAVVLIFMIFGASMISSIVLIAALIFVVIYGFIRWFVYANDIFILTNQRIINIDQGGFFSRRVSEAELGNILNVSYEIKGPIKSLLNFGEVNIDTSGSDNNALILKNVENPHFIQEKIVSLQKKSQNQTIVRDKPVLR